MPSKKAPKPAPKPAAPKPAPKRRAPKKEPPIDHDEIMFCYAILQGKKNPKLSNLEHIEAAGARMGWDKATSSRVYHRKAVQTWLEAYHLQTMKRMVSEDVREMRRAGYTREDVLTALWELGTLPPERTKGSILGQVAAFEEMTKVMGIVVAPRNADEFFKGRSEEEIACFAEHGIFKKPVVQ